MVNDEYFGYDLGDVGLSCMKRVYACWVRVFAMKEGSRLVELIFSLCKWINV